MYMLFPQKEKSFATKIRDWVLDHLWTHLDPQDYIFHLQIDITNACNLACTHCYLPHHKNSGALKFEDWCRVVDQFPIRLVRPIFQPIPTVQEGTLEKYKNSLAKGLAEFINFIIKGESK
jgi:sulfatase maturation enzyme AslB (radical SAM superfamily)